MTVVGEEDGHMQIRHENTFEPKSARGARASVTRRVVLGCASHVSCIRGCGVGEKRIAKRRAGHSGVEFLPFQFPHRRGQRRERVCPLKGGQLIRGGEGASASGQGK